jgi:hypothetical protein
MFNFVPQFFRVVLNKTRRLADILLHSQAPTALEIFQDFLSQHGFSKDSGRDLFSWFV